MATLQFSTAQKDAITKGAMKRNSLLREAKKAAQRAAGKSIREEYLDTILSGTTGIGKTFNIEKEVEALGIPYLTIKGNKSMFAFGADLMLLHHAIPKGQKMALIIDDCDSFFESKENRNILKGLTGKSGSRQFQYNKKVNPHMFTEQQNAIMELYQTPGMHGFTVPTDNFVFIFTTNLPLPYESEAKLAVDSGSSAKAIKLLDLVAIRGRHNVKDFFLNFEENWGWIAHVGLNDGGLDMLETEEEKILLLDWMWNNWHQMTETNIRTIEKMAYEIIDDADNYRDNWEMDFIKF